MLEADIIRFWSKVNKTSESCWLWTGTLNHGYGRFWYNNENHGAHQISYFLYNKKWAKNFVCHTCNNPLCVNPLHLYDGTPLQNSADRVGAGTLLKGDKNPSSKLNDEQVLMIRKDPRTLKEIAKDFNVHLSLISLIKQRKIWSHLEGEIVFNPKTWKLDQVQIDAIMIDPRSSRVIAKEYGVSKDAILNIKRKIRQKGA